MTEIKRLNYFTSQFLVAKDFTDEQAYHIRKRRLHNQWLHSWGVAGDGLQVKRKAAKSIEISRGIAIDKNRDELVLLDPVTIDLSTNPAKATVWVTARFEEVKLPDDRYPIGAADQYTRLTERTNIELGNAAPVTDGSVILLATVTLDESGNIDKVANDVRKFAGISPGTGVGPPTPAGANTLDVQRRRERRRTLSRRRPSPRMRGPIRPVRRSTSPRTASRTAEASSSAIRMGRRVSASASTRSMRRDRTPTNLCI